MKYGIYIVIVIMTFIGSIASLFFKKASNNESILDLIKNKFLYIGGFLYVTSAVLNIIVLKFLDYSIVLPLTSITYIWTMIISYIALKEKITKRKILGVGLILTGAILIC